MDRLRHIFYRVKNMSAISKFLIIFGLNFFALTLLIYRLIKDGNKYSAALRMAWDWILFQNEVKFLVDPRPPLLWALFLGKTWWLMLLIFGISWVS